MTCLSRNPETEELNKFVEAYQLAFETTTVCFHCKHNSISKETCFMISIPTISQSFTENLKLFFRDEFEDDCLYCRQKCKQMITRQITKAPLYIMIQLLRFSLDKTSATISKNEVEIDLPLVLEQHFPSKYHLFGAIYHLGSEIICGHYLSKTLVPNSKGSKTFDDARCYVNIAEKSIPAKHAYLVMYQRDDLFNEKSLVPIDDRESYIEKARRTIAESKKIKIEEKQKPSKEKKRKLTLKKKEKIKI